MFGSKMCGAIHLRRLAIPRANPDGGCMFRLLCCLLFLLSAILRAGDAREDWAAVKALDAGPGVQPKTAADALAVARAHSEKQEGALRNFLAAHPDDPNVFESLLRLARVLELRAEMKIAPPSAEVAELLEKAGGLATTPARKTEFEFSQLTRRMRQWRATRPPAEERRALLGQARQFASAHPGDRRIASLVAEVASLFDGDPATKESLLLQAKKLTKDPGVLAKIADDLRRLDFLGKPLPLRFTALDGRRVDVKAWEGKVVAIVFFATWSAPSEVALAEIARAVQATGGRAELAAVSLDFMRADLENFLREKSLACPVAWDGRGWDGPLIQALGINAVPTAWLLDPKGVLRSLDATEDTAGQINRLLGGK